MTAAFVLGQNVDLRLEDLVGMDRTGLSQNLATLDLGNIDLILNDRNWGIEPCLLKS